MKRFNGRSRILGILVVAAALGTGAYAFTATNTVPNSSAGRRIHSGGGCGGRASSAGTRPG